MQPSSLWFCSFDATEPLLHNARADFTADVMTEREV